MALPSSCFELPRSEKRSLPGAMNDSEVSGLLLSSLGEGPSLGTLNKRGLRVIRTPPKRPCFFWRSDLSVFLLLGFSTSGWVFR